MEILQFRSQTPKSRLMSKPKFRVDWEPIRAGVRASLGECKIHIHIFVPIFLRSRYQLLTFVPKSRNGYQPWQKTSELDKKAQEQVDFAKKRKNNLYFFKKRLEKAEKKLEEYLNQTPSPKRQLPVEKRQNGPLSPTLLMVRTISSDY